MKPLQTYSVMIKNETFDNSGRHPQECLCCWSHRSGLYSRNGFELARHTRKEQTLWNNQNHRSSHSYTIFRMTLKSRGKGESSHFDSIKVSHLNLVDLALGITPRQSSEPIIVCEGPKYPYFGTEMREKTFRTQ